MQMLIVLKLEIASNTITGENFNTTLSSMRQKINKGTLALNNTLDQVDLTFTKQIFENSTRRQQNIYCRNCMKDSS